MAKVKRRVPKAQKREAAAMPGRKRADPSDRLFLPRKSPGGEFAYAREGSRALPAIQPARKRPLSGVYGD